MCFNLHAYLRYNLLQAFFYGSGSSEAFYNYTFFLLKSKSIKFAKKGIAYKFLCVKL